MAAETSRSASSNPADTSPTVRVPEIYDPYIGTAFGNILDLHDNPTYNIRIALVRDTTPGIGTANAATTSSATPSTTDNPRADTPTASTATAPQPSSARGPVAPGDMIVIAQTGVTGIIVDDLQLTTGADFTLGYWPTKIEFKLKQPGGANLIDQMLVARKFLGIDSSNAQFLVLVEISFMGRKADPDDEDNGGAPVVVDGPYGWLCSTTKVDINVNQEGSEYFFAVSPMSAIMYNDRDFRIPHDITCTGSTIKQCVSTFQKALNDSLEKNKPSNYKKADVYEIDTSKLLGNTKPLIPGEGKLRSPADVDTNPENSSGAGVARTNTSADTSSSVQTIANTGQPDKVYKEQVFAVPAKTDFYNFFVKLLSTCDEFVDKTVNLKDKDRYGSEPDPNKVFLHWLSIEMDVQYLEFDKGRNDYTKKIIVRPVVYESARSDLSLKLEEPSTLGQEAKNEENAATFKVMQMRKNGQLLKSYKYLFTGLNDQIVNLEMKFDPGTVVLSPPRDGLIGDTSLATAPMINPTQPLNKNLNVAGGVLGVIDKLKDATKLANLVKNLSQGQLTSIAAAAGLDPQSLAAGLQSNAQKTASELADKLSSRTLNQVTSALDKAQSDAAAGGPPKATNPDGTAYDPDSSGIIYAEDLLTNIMEKAGGLTMEQIRAAGLVRASDIDASTFDLKPAVGTDYDVASNGPATSMISKTGSPSNVLFNFMYAKHAMVNTMLVVDMTIRGDPWYLGAAKGKSTATAAALDMQGQNHFLLQVATPPPYDLDVEEEDKNTGYRYMNGLSNSMSGIYQVINVVNKFSNGMFTSMIKGTKLYDVPLYKIRPLEPGKPIDLGGVDKETGVALGGQANADKYLIKAPAPAGDAGTGGTTGGTSPGAVNPNGWTNPLGTANYVVKGTFDEQRSYEVHKGVDLAVAAGTPIYAAKGGTVVRSEFSSSYGNVVYIDHGDGTQSRYAHMQNLSSYKAGQQISTGAQIGNVGSTGRSEGPHLHFEIRTGNGATTDNSTIPVNPLPYIKG